MENENGRLCWRVISLQGGFIPYPVESGFFFTKAATDKASGELKPLLHLLKWGLVENYNGSFLLRGYPGGIFPPEPGKGREAYPERISGILGFDSKGASFYTDGIEFFLNGNPVKNQWLH